MECSGKYKDPWYGDGVDSDISVDESFEVEPKNPDVKDDGFSSLPKGSQCLDYVPSHTSRSIWMLP